MQNEKKYTLAELTILATRANVPLADLQKEYGVYEFSFTTCAEAKSKYHFGYKSCIFPADPCKYDEPEIAAYHKAWREISLLEVPDVNKLSYAQATAFSLVCFPYGDQLSALVSKIERCLGNDICRIALFFKKGHTFTFYEPNECPFEALSDRLKSKINIHYTDRIKKAKGLKQLTKIQSELHEYGIHDIRPFPDFYDLLSRKIANSAKNIAELAEMGCFGKYGLERWEFLCKKAPLSEIFPSLVQFLRAANQQPFSGIVRTKPAWVKIQHFFSRCKDESEARFMLDIGRSFMGTEDNKDCTYDECYKPAMDRITRSLYPRPKLGDFKNIMRSLCRDTSEHYKMDHSWKKKTEEALLKPIHSFHSLYKNAHEARRSMVLEKWNIWGRQQLVGIETWEELCKFDFALFPIPVSNSHWECFILSKNRNDFSAFIVYLRKLFKTASTLEQKMKVFHLVLKMGKLMEECQAGDIFFEELKIIVDSILAEDLSVSATLDILKEVPQNYYIFDSLTAIKETIIEKILEKDLSMIDQILLFIGKESPLYRKCVRRKIDSLTA